MRNDEMAESYDHLNVRKPSESIMILSLITVGRKYFLSFQQKN